MRQPRALRVGITTVFTTLGLVAGLALVTAPYAAADETIVVHGPGGFPDGSTQGTVQQPCDDVGGDPGVGGGVTFLLHGPKPTPLGERVWGFDPEHDGVGDGPYRDLSLIADDASASLQVYAVNQTDGVAWAMLRDSDDTVWFGGSPVSITDTGAWTTISQDSDTSYDWVQRNNDGSATGETFTGTIDELSDDVGPGDFSGELGFALGCNANGRYYLDDFEVGTPGDVITFDFEGLTTFTTIRGSRHVVTAGQPVTLKGVTRPGRNGFFTEASIVLEAKPFGSARWHRVGRATETWDGEIHPATMKVRPQTRTAYRWHWLETRGSDASVSKTFLVKVHPNVTAHPAARSVRLGQQIVVFGRVLPDKRGRQVALMRGGAVVDRATVRPDGTFTLHKRASSSGAWRLHVAISKTPGNLPGRSPAFTIHVG